MEIMPDQNATHGMKSRIRQAAAAVFGRKGLDGLTMRAIAREVGVSATAIYRHYPNRDAILAEVWQVGFGSLAESMQAPIESADGTERILTLLDRYVRWALDQPDVFDLMYKFDPQHLTLLPRASSGEVGNVDNAAIAVLVREIENAMRSGQWRTENVYDVALTIWAEGKGLIALHRSSRIDVPAEEMPAVARKAMSLLIRGLEAR
jgi:AcrR family transcriptional regulator